MGLTIGRDVNLYIYPTAEICENGIDDDGDGYIDCDCISEQNLIYGEVFHDLNFNGTKEVSEEGVQNVPVFLVEDSNNNGFYNPGTDNIVDTSYTNALGVYNLNAAGLEKYESRVIGDADDAKEDMSNGNMSVYTDGINIGEGWPTEENATIAGFRFRNVSIPYGKAITGAYLTFTAKSNQSGNAMFDIWAAE